MTKSAIQRIFKIWFRLGVVIFTTFPIIVGVYIYIEKQDFHPLYAGIIGGIIATMLLSIMYKIMYLLIDKFKE